MSRTSTGYQESEIVGSCHCKDYLIYKQYHPCLIKLSYHRSMNTFSITNSTDSCLPRAQMYFIWPSRDEMGRLSRPILCMAYSKVKSNHSMEQFLLTGCSSKKQDIDFMNFFFQKKSKAGKELLLYMHTYLLKTLTILLYRHT